MDLDGLTAQQRIVFNWLIRGKTNREIGEQLNCAEKTIKAHVTHIFKKMGCKSRSQLIAKHYLEQTA